MILVNVDGDVRVDGLVVRLAERHVVALLEVRRPQSIGLANFDVQFPGEHFAVVGALRRWLRGGYWRLLGSRRGAKLDAR